MAPTRAIRKDDETDQRLAESRMEDEGGPPLPPENPRAGATGPATSATGKPAALTVGEIMTKAVRSVTGDMPIKEVALLMAGEGIGAVPVVLPDRRLLGLVTDRDIVIRACAGDKSIDDIYAADAMTADPTGISADKTVSDALVMMARQQVHRLPVVDDQLRLVGMVSTADIASRSDSSAELRAALAEISNRRSFWSRAWR